jgi:pyruvate formate lyase activating enzyme
MRIGGLQKFSLIDYPGKVSCVIFLLECNFDCPYCHNPKLIKRDRWRGHFPSENEILEFLERRIGLLDGVVISGGEPTLQKGLSSLCEKIKQLGYPIKLDTNGSLPDVIERLINDGLVDYIAMDIKTNPFDYDPLIAKNCNPYHVLASIKAIMESGLDYEFRTTCVKPIVDSHVIKKIAKIIKGATLYALQRFHNSTILHPEFFRETTPEYSEDELMGLKSIAEPWVKKCIVR